MSSRYNKISVYKAYALRFVSHTKGRGYPGWAHCKLIIFHRLRSIRSSKCSAKPQFWENLTFCRVVLLFCLEKEELEGQKELGQRQQHQEKLLCCGFKTKQRTYLSIEQHQEEHRNCQKLSGKWELHGKLSSKLAKRRSICAFHNNTHLQKGAGYGLWDGRKMGWTSVW